MIPAMKKNKKNKKEKIKVIYKEDTGETVYSMAALDGRTPEEVEEAARRKESRVKLSKKERGAMIKAAFSVYAPILLCFVAAFLFTALVLYFFLK